MTRTIMEFGAVGDGKADESAAFLRANESLRDGEELALQAHATYRIDATGGVKFTQRLRLAGNEAAIVTGPNVAATPAPRGVPTLTFLADGTEIEDLTVIGLVRKPMPQKQTALNVGIYVAGRTQEDRIADVTLDNVCFVDCEVGLCLKVAKSFAVFSCSVLSLIGEWSGWLGSYAGISLIDCEKGLIQDCNVSGGSNAVLLSSSDRVCIQHNTISGVSNNGIYVSSGRDCRIQFNRINGFDDAGIKTRGAGHAIVENVILRGREALTPGSVPHGINCTPDKQGYGHGVQVEDNLLVGEMVYGIRTSRHAGRLLTDPKINDNRFDLRRPESKNVVIEQQ